MCDDAPSAAANKRPALYINLNHGALDGVGVRVPKDNFIVVRLWCSGGLS